jgi:hypothetical protein
VDEFDIDLEEFSDEIDTWIIDEFKRIGCDTARSVLKLSAEELERRTDWKKKPLQKFAKSWKMNSIQRNKQLNTSYLCLNLDVYRVGEDR